MQKIIIWPVSIFILLIVFFISMATYARAERRTALVIGNSNYEISPLKNPVNDASDIALALQKSGFTVIMKKNADLQTMEEAIEEFGNRLKPGGVGLFYYAGHGLQVNGTNYLIPVGAKINKESDVRYKAVDVGRVLDEMGNANNGLNMVILDACRDNPFARGFRSATRGLAIINTSPTGTFIAYSTSPGQVAQDGDGRNSPFTAALLDSIKIPALPVEQVFKRVRQKLDASSGGRQVPWELSSIKGDFYFTALAGQSISDIAPIATKPEENPILKRAQAAYDAGHYAEPEGENVIELARQILSDDIGSQSAKELMAQAVKAYENQAKLALANGDKKAAQGIYRRLFKLFPDQEIYLKEIIALETPVVPDIAGVWKWSVRSPFVPDRINTIKADGSCTLNDMTGTWVYKKDDQKPYQFYWSDTWTHKMTLSKDGQMMIGTDDWGTRVTGLKIK